MISLRGGGSALTLRFRITYGSRNSITGGAVEVRRPTSLLLWRNTNSSKRLSHRQAVPGYSLVFSKDLWSSSELDLSLF